VELTREEIFSAYNAVVRAMSIIYELPDSIGNARVYEQLLQTRDTLKRAYFETEQTEHQE
jgi:hypothetical protein